MLLISLSSLFFFFFDKCHSTFTILRHSHVTNRNIFRSVSDIVSNHAFSSLLMFKCIFLYRMGFSAEQLAKWVGERTDVHVSVFIFCVTAELL